jgi:transposase
MKASASSRTIATIGIDIGKNTFHLVGLDERGAIVLRMRRDAKHRHNRRPTAHA